jgi:hypothetical protein
VAVDEELDDEVDVVEDGLEVLDDVDEVDVLEVVLESDDVVDAPSFLVSPAPLPFAGAEADLAVARESVL